MDLTYQRHLSAAQSQRVLELLTQQQHLHPHRTLKQAIDQAAGDIGFCPDAAREAVDGLRLDGAGRIGRLRRSDLAALANSIDRYWRQALQGSR